MSIHLQPPPMLTLRCNIRHCKPHTMQYQCHPHPCSHHQVPATPTGSQYHVTLYIYIYWIYIYIYMTPYTKPLTYNWRHCLFIPLRKQKQSTLTQTVHFSFCRVPEENRKLTGRLTCSFQFYRSSGRLTGSLRGSCCFAWVPEGSQKFSGRPSGRKIIIRYLEKINVSSLTPVSQQKSIVFGKQSIIHRGVK